MNMQEMMRKDNIVNLPMLKNQPTNENIINAIANLSPSDLILLLEKRNLAIQEQNNSRFVTNELKLDEIQEKVNKINEKSIYMNDDNFKNLTNMGMDYNPQISNQSFSIILKWLKVTKYNSSSKSYVPIQEALYRNIAREQQTKEINGKIHITYIYNSQKIKEMLVRKLTKTNLLTQFEKHISSQERNDWIRATLIV